MPLALLAPASCSGGGGGGTPSAGEKPASACPLIATLDQTAADVAQADVSDPDAFAQTLENAVARYTSTVTDLKKVVPDSLDPDLDRLLAAVQQQRFEDAVRARASLDAWAATECGRRTTSTLPPVPGSPTTAAPS